MIVSHLNAAFSRQNFDRESTRDPRRRGGATDDLALDSAFSYKASLNRPFRAAFDCSLSVYRHAHGLNQQ